MPLSRPPLGTGLGLFLAVLSAAGWAPRAPGQDFRRGDVDVNGRVGVQDAVYIVMPPFLPGGPHFQCEDAADADDNGAVNITDGVRILNVVFLGIGVLPPDCGPDPTDDGLGCAEYPPALCTEPSPPAPLDPRFELRIATPGGAGNPGSPASAEVLVQVCSEVPVPWWNIGVAVEGDCRIDTVTTDGTLAAPVERGGLVDGGFVRSEIIDAARNEGRLGAVSAVLLGLVAIAELPVTGTGAACAAPNNVLKLTLSSTDSPAGCCAACTLTFTDGLAGSGQPVENLVGLSTDPPSAVRPTITGATITLGSGLEPFRRGDVGADGETTISDAIRILDFLFTGETALACEDAADTDDNGEIDITDPIRLLDFLFLGEVEISPPLFECGLDGTRDALDCGKSDCPS
jgi:hypothetical protein